MKKSYLDIGGYVLIYMPAHPRANKAGYVREHIVVMEEKIGREVKVGEPVHHIDMNRANNSPDNLMLFSSGSEHMLYHGQLIYDDVNEQLRSLSDGQWLHAWHSEWSILTDVEKIFRSVGLRREAVSVASVLLCKISMAFEICGYKIDRASCEADMLYLVHEMVNGGYQGAVAWTGLLSRPKLRKLLEKRPVGRPRKETNDGSQQ